MLERLATILAYEKYKDTGVTAIRAEISLGIDNVSVKIGGRKDVMEALDMTEELERFSKEVKPIVSKYADIITEKFTDFIKKDPKEAAEKMATWMGLEKYKEES